MSPHMKLTSQSRYVAESDQVELGRYDWETRMTRSERVGEAVEAGQALEGKEGGRKLTASGSFLRLPGRLFGHRDGLVSGTAGRMEATVVMAATRTASYRFDEAGKVDVGRCFIGNGGEQGAVYCLFACLAFLSALGFHQFALFHYGKSYPDPSLSIGPFFAMEASESVTCSGV